MNNYNMIYDEGEGLASPFVKGKSLSEQLREERLKIEKQNKKPFAESARYHAKKRPMLKFSKPDFSQKSSYFIKRGRECKFVQPHLELSDLEREVSKFFPSDYKITSKVRFQEVIAAKRMFIFFATTYLHLNSTRIAKYLHMDRSTLSHHVYAAMDELDMYPHIRLKAIAIDNYLYDRHEQLRQTIHN